LLSVPDFKSRANSCEAIEPHMTVMVFSIII